MYTFLLGIPAFFISLVLAVVVTGAVVGAFWLFIFGDDTWKIPMQTIIIISFPLSFLTFWTTSVIVGYRVGKQMEDTSPLNRKHLFLSIITTALFLGIIYSRNLIIQDNIEKEKQKQMFDTRLQESIFKVRDIMIEQKGNMVLIRPILDGTFPGKYKISMSISKGPVLVKASEDLTLPLNGMEFLFRIPLSSIQQGFRNKRMGGSREEVIVGSMNYRFNIKTELIKAIGSEVIIPSLSPYRRSSFHKSIKLYLGRF